MTTREEFLAAVLADSGCYCVVGIRNKKVRQAFVHTVGEIGALTDALLQQGFDVYFACSSFKEPTSRTQDNAQYEKALWLDLDCGETKSYPTQAEAIEALQVFCSATGLPRPIIVNSGWGVHAYWPFTEKIPAKEWTALAERFKQLCDDKGLQADPSVTADSARILRVPETRNFKDLNNIRDVEVLCLGEPTDVEELKALFPEGRETVDVRLLSRSVIQFKDPLTESLAGNKESSFAKIARRSLGGSGCGQIQSAITDHAGTAEPIWRGVLSIAWQCIDRDDAIHAVSNKHPAYSHYETEDKARSTKGPYTCETLEKLNPGGGCATCPHKGKITSPIQLGKIILKALPPTPEKVYEGVLEERPPEKENRFSELFDVEGGLPWPYYRGLNGGIYKKLQKDDAEDSLVYAHDFYPIDRLIDPEIGEALIMRLHLPHDDVRDFTLPYSSLVSMDLFKKTCAEAGVAASIREFPEVNNYVSSMGKIMQTLQKAKETRTQYGWTKEETFVLGRMEYTDTGSKYVPPPAHGFCGTLHIPEAAGPLASGLI